MEKGIQNRATEGFGLKSFAHLFPLARFDHHLYVGSFKISNLLCCVFNSNQNESVSPTY